MKQAGCCLTLFDPAKGAPEVEFEMTRSEIEPMDVTVTRDRGLGQSDEQVRFEGGRILTLREAESTRTWRQEQDIRSLPAPPGSLGGFAFAWAGEVRLTNEDVDNWRVQYRADAGLPLARPPRLPPVPALRPAGRAGRRRHVFHGLAGARADHGDGPQNPHDASPVLPAVHRAHRAAGRSPIPPPAPLQLAVAERPELPSMADRISTLESLRASGGITEAEFARAKALAEHAWEDFLDSTEPFGVRHRFAAGPSTASTCISGGCGRGPSTPLCGFFTLTTPAWCPSRGRRRQGAPYNLRDPAARCRREGCDRSRAPDGMPLKTCARCRSVMYCSPVRLASPESSHLTRRWLGGGAHAVAATHRCKTHLHTGLPEGRLEKT